MRLKPSNRIGGPDPPDMQELNDLTAEVAKMREEIRTLQEELRRENIRRGWHQDRIHVLEDEMNKLTKTESKEVEKKKNLKEQYPGPSSSSSVKNEAGWRERLQGPWRGNVWNPWVLGNGEVLWIQGFGKW